MMEAVDQSLASNGDRVEIGGIPEEAGIPSGTGLG